MQICNNHNRQAPDKRSGAYATKQDFCRIVSEETNSLYLLSLLLTADREKAEQCFVAGIEECSAGRPVFKEWAHSWTRRTIVKCAIRATAPKANPTRVSVAMTMTSVATRSENDAFLVAVTQLRPLERFAFVMSFLERYSDKDCCVLLGCSRLDLMNARSRALEELSAFHVARRAVRESQQIEMRSSRHKKAAVYSAAGDGNIKL
jgi:hypothetical protein